MPKTLRDFHRSAVRSVLRERVKSLALSDHLLHILFSALFPLFAYFCGIKPRNDSLNKFDNLILFSRFFRQESQFPSWTTLNFGSLSSLENLGLRPEETFAIILSRILQLNSIESLVYLVIFLALIAMNYCFSSICKTLGIYNRRLIYALILILNFTAFPFSQYWLHFLVILNTVVLLRIYLSINFNSLGSNISLIIPVSFILWGGYTSILPAVALIPVLLLRINPYIYKLNTSIKSPKQKLRITYILVAFVSFFLFVTFATLYFTQNRVVVTGRDENGIASIDSFLGPAGKGFLKYIEILGAPTVWQDTHIVVSPILIPLIISFILIGFPKLLTMDKVIFLVFLFTCVWTILLTLPNDEISRFIYQFFPLYRLTRNPGFQSGILIPILLILLGLVYSSRINGGGERMSDGKKKTPVNRNVRQDKKLSRIDSREKNRNWIKIHACTWAIVIMLHILGIHYPAVWTKAFFGHFLSPIVFILFFVTTLLIYFPSEADKEHKNSRKNGKIIDLRFQLTNLILLLSSSTIFLLGIFQMYFLSFVDYRTVSEMNSNLVNLSGDQNLIQRERVRESLKGKILGWENLSQEVRDKLVNQARLLQLGKSEDPVWMKLIDSDRTNYFRTKPFDEFTSKTFFNQVLNEQSPLIITNPNNSLRAPIRMASSITTNLISTSAYGLNEDYCPSLGGAQSVSKVLSNRVVNSLNQTEGGPANVCSGNKVSFLDSKGQSADHWFESARLSITNGSVKVRIKVKKEYVGRLTTLVYRDAYSKFWSVQIDGKHYPLDSTDDGFKSVNFKLRATETSIEFVLKYRFQLLANARLITDPILYLGFILYTRLRNGESNFI